MARARDKNFFSTSMIAVGEWPLVELKREGAIDVVITNVARKDAPLVIVDRVTTPVRLVRLESALLQRGESVHTAVMPGYKVVAEWQPVRRADQPNARYPMRDHVFEVTRMPVSHVERAHS